MKVKTYGVLGLTEWYGKVKAGSVEVSVSFTGGTASPTGAQPAYFMTKDPIVQFVIENSKEFKSGFIVTVMSQDIAGEHPRMAIPKPKTVPTTEMPSSTTEDNVVNDEQPLTNQAKECDGENKYSDGIKVNVADRNEAIEYLKEHFADKNYTATGLRAKTAFETACKECGVVFEFTV